MFTDIQTISQKRWGIFTSLATGIEMYLFQSNLTAGLRHSSATRICKALLLQGILMNILKRWHEIPIEKVGICHKRGTKYFQTLCLSILTNDFGKKEIKKLFRTLRGMQELKGELIFTLKRIWLDKAGICPSVPIEQQSLPN